MLDRHRFTWLQTASWARIAGFIVIGGLVSLPSTAFSQEPDDDEEVPDTTPLTPAPTTAPPPPPPPPPPADGQFGEHQEAYEDQVQRGPAVEPFPNAVDGIEADGTGEDAEEIVVTGSSIRRQDLITPAPVSVVGKLELETSGMVSIADVLQDIPSQGNAINVQFNNGGDGSSTISLRSLGAARTLVLLNGRRHVASGPGGAVDLNAIPTAVIERVEVLKDGGSAIYGSDAIGGVVNIILKRDFQGVEGSVYTGTTDVGGLIYDVSVTAGQATDKGSIMFSAGYYNQSEILAGERDFSEFDLNYDFDAEEGTPEEDRVSKGGSTGVPQGLIIPRVDADRGNQAWQDVLAGDPPDPDGERQGQYYLDPDTGQWRIFQAGGTSDTGEGDEYNYQPENYLYTPQERYSVFTTGNYELSDHARFYAEGSYLHRSSDQLLAPEPLFTISEGLTVSANNVYNPFGRDFVDVRRRLLEFGNRRDLQEVDTFRIVTGLDGYVDDETPGIGGWRWDLSFNYGRTGYQNRKEGRLHLSKLANALGPSFVDDDGAAVCGTPDNPIDGCVPLNLFGGAYSITPDQISGLTYTGIASLFQTQRIVSASTTGTLGQIPGGGPIGLAIGAEYREEEGGFQPDPLTAIGDTTGNKGEPTLGEFNVMEAYAEVSLIPIEAKPFAEIVELSAAVRAFDYDTFEAEELGDSLTWKVGTRWQIIEDFALRGTASTAFRAPSISNLFAGQSDSFPNVTDPCSVEDSSGKPRELSPEVAANCAAQGVPADFVDRRSQLRGRVGGNENLTPEKANIFTIGTVVEPTALDGLTFTVDYWNVTIDNAIQPIGFNVILSQCYEQGDPEGCGLIQRDSNNLISNITNLTTNVGSVETAGIDFYVQYNIGLGAPGNVRLTLDLTWLQKYNEVQGNGNVIEGKGVYDLGVFPDVKAQHSAIWSRDGWMVGESLHFISGIEECKNSDCDSVVPEGQPMAGERVNPSREVDAYLTADLFGGYSFESELGRSQFSVGINNIWNQAPPLIYTGFLANSDAATYDYLGRWYYLRFTQSY